MESSDDLFLLIKSLSKTEKRYFKVNSSRKQNHEEKKNYLKLFELIDKQKIYNEKEVVEQFSDELFVKNISSEKNYLYHRILKTLSSYYSQSSIDTVADDLICFSEILYSKGLYSQSEKSIKKATKIIEENELLPQALKLFRHEVSLYPHSSPTSEKLEKNFLKTISDSKLALQKLTNIHEYYELYSRFFVMIRKDGELVRSQEELIKYDEIMNHPLMMDEKLALSKDAKSLHYSIKYFYFYISERLQEAYDNFKKMSIELPVGNESRNGPLDEMVRLSNFCDICLRMKKFSEVESTLNQMKLLPNKSILDNGKYFHRYYTLLLRLYIQTGQYDDAVKLASTIENGLIEYKNIIHKSKIIILNYFVAYSYFLTGDYKNSLKWINNILNDKGVDLRKDILCYARILNLMVAYEKKDFILIEHLVRATQYYFSTREKLFKIEILALSFFKKHTSGWSDEESHLLLQKLEIDLSQLADDNYEKGVLDFLDLLSWTRNKISLQSI